MSMDDWRCVICGYVEEDVLHTSDLGECKKCHSRSWSKVPPTPTFKVTDGTPKFHGGEE